LDIYLSHPVLIGGKTSNGSFDFIPIDGISSGSLEPANTSTVLCLMYQLAIYGFQPQTLGNIVDIPLEVLSWVTGKLNPIFENYGCPLVNP
jgi:hypothetical protein